MKVLEVFTDLYNLSFACKQSKFNNRFLAKKLLSIIYVERDLSTVYTKSGKYIKDQIKDMMFFLVLYIIIICTLSTCQSKLYV